MKISYDEIKRLAILAERNLDIANAAQVFSGFHLTRFDAKHSDTEDRYITVGTIGETVVLMVWTQRDGERRIVTMWKANVRERVFLRNGSERGG